MGTYSITMMTPETRVYLNRPFSKPVRYIELQECYAPSEWITLTTLREEITVVENAQSSIGIEFQAGYYTMEALQIRINRNSKDTDLTMFSDGVRYFLHSKTSPEVRISAQLAYELGLPRKLLKGKNYMINQPPKKRLKVYCDLVEGSYESNDRKDRNKSPRGTFNDKDETHVISSGLLAVVPSQRYPLLKVSDSNHPINYFTLRVLDERGHKLKFYNCPLRINLKLTF